MRESVEEGGGVLVEALEDIVHERLADEFAAVLHCVFVAIALQRPHLAVVQRDGYPMSPTLFHGSTLFKKQLMTNYTTIIC